MGARQADRRQEVRSGVRHRLQSWGEWFYVDGLAGSGVNRIAEEGGRLIWGSPVIALRAQPPFANCLFLEQDAARAAALDHRTAALADRRVVEQGEVNTNLLRVMRAHLPRRNPVLVVLDPYGMEIDWTTLQDIATFRQYKWKAEILILFPIDGINRAMHALGDVDETTLDRFWGDKSWHQLWKEQKMGQLRTPDQTRNRGLQLYTDRLKNELRYAHALSMDVRRAGHTGGLKYIRSWPSRSRKAWPGLSITPCPSQSCSCTRSLVDTSSSLR
jgi:three-Cys-motif partner protein